uniref:hypothetical protein n=1 Tax=Borreliella garinii TaxID=29519 RepID=UPI00359CA537
MGARNDNVVSWSCYYISFYLYLGVAIISAFICRLGESEMWDAFVKGSDEKV